MTCARLRRAVAAALAAAIALPAVASASSLSVLAPLAPVRSAGAGHPIAGVASGAVARELTQLTGLTPARSITAVSALYGPLPGPAPVNTVAPHITGAAVPGQTLSVSGGTWSEPGSLATVLTAPHIAPTPDGRSVEVSGGRYRDTRTVTVQFYRCAPACVPTGPATTTSEHLLTSADAGALLRATVTLHGPAGTRPAHWATGVAGPVDGLRVASAALTAGRSAWLRTPAGITLASAVLTRSGTRTATVALRRAATAGGSLSAYACAVSATGLDRCSALRSLTTSGLTLWLASAPSGDRVLLVVESTPRPTAARTVRRAQSPSSARRRTTNS